MHKYVFTLHFDCGLAGKTSITKGRGKHGRRPGRRRGKNKKRRRGKKLRRQNRSYPPPKDDSRPGIGIRPPRRKPVCERNSEAARVTCRLQRQRGRGIYSPLATLRFRLPPGVGRSGMPPGGYLRKRFKGNTTLCVTSLFETAHLRNAPL